MNIIRKEVLEFSEREADAIRLTMEICSGLMREATNPELKKLAETTYNNVAELWGWDDCELL